MRVLVIDDEKNLADTVVWILEENGFEAVAAYTGAAALEKICSFPPDIVISDVIMPGMNGIDVCSIVQTKFPYCHILLFSGQAVTSELLYNARRKGFEWELLAKPVDPEELLAKLNTLSKNDL
ncbi:MAG: response regulator [Acidobacteriota bacterium]|nr:response regulator [Acidobacteriota bacterium]